MDPVGSKTSRYGVCVDLVPTTMFTHRPEQLLVLVIFGPDRRGYLACGPCELEGTPEDERLEYGKRLSSTLVAHSNAVSWVVKPLAICAGCTQVEHAGAGTRSSD